MERAQRRFGLFEEGVVAGVLDHVQRSAIAGARGLGDPHPGLEIVPPPDQGRGNGDVLEVRRRDQPHPELPHEAAESGPHVRRARPVERVCRERLPLLTHLLADAIKVDEALLEETVPRALGRSCHEADQSEREQQCRQVPTRPNWITEKGRTNGKRGTEPAPVNGLLLEPLEPARGRSSRRRPLHYWAPRIDQRTPTRPGGLD